MSRTGGLISERGFSITSAALGGLTRFTCKHLRPSLERVQKHIVRTRAGRPRDVHLALSSAIQRRLRCADTR